MDSIRLSVPKPLGEPVQKGGLLKGGQIPVPDALVWHFGKGKLLNDQALDDMMENQDNATTCTLHWKRRGHIDDRKPVAELSGSFVIPRPTRKPGLAWSEFQMSFESEAAEGWFYCRREAKFRLLGAPILSADPIALEDIQEALKGHLEVSAGSSAADPVVSPSVHDAIQKQVPLSPVDIPAASDVKAPAAR